MGPLLWVVMGAAAISTNAGTQLIAIPEPLPFLAAQRPFVDGVSMMLWAWATWWIPLLLLFFVAVGLCLYLDRRRAKKEARQAAATGASADRGTSAEALRLVWAIRDLDWRGMDIVEVSPPYDHADVTAVAGSAVAQHYIQALALKKRG